MAQADVQVTAYRLRAALALQDSPLESTSALLPDQATPHLRGPGKQKQLDRLGKVLESAKNSNPGLIADVQRQAEQTLDQLSAGGALTFEGQVGLEAMVMLTGRPALRVKEGKIDPNNPLASEWKAALMLANVHGELDERLKRVCRIDINGIHIGSGFLCGDGLVMTNRHVLQSLASPIPSRTNPSQWILDKGEPMVDFNEEPDPAKSTTRFRILEVCAAGPDEIDANRIDLALLDLAILRIERINSSNSPSPTPLELVLNSGRTRLNDPIFAIGFPARPQQLPSGGSKSTELLERLVTLFDDYSVKYLSPGLVIGSATAIANTPEKWALQHDATTLGGSSGSCLLTPDNPLGAVALHFGGAWLKRNYAHALFAVREHSNLMNGLELNWK